MPILQVNFKLDLPVEEYRKMCASVAQAVADVPGLQWKLWLLNEERKEAGGIYLFSSEEALNDYLGGPIVAAVKQHPGIQDVSVKRFDFAADLSARTRGPVSATAAAE